MNIQFAGKRAVVTGAGRGVGRALALKLSECGASVIAVSRTKNVLESLKLEDRRIKTICLDVGDWAATKKAIEDLGPIDFLVNNAAIMDVKEYGDITESEVDKSLNINVKAIINISQIVANGMKKKGTGGAIVNVSSMLAMHSFHSYGVYGATKGAVDQLTRSMALEFGPHKIRVNSVNPTIIRTDMAIKAGLFDPGNKEVNDMANRSPLKRFCEVEEVVFPILFLLSDKAAMINGITLPIDGGLHVNT